MTVEDAQAQAAQLRKSVASSKTCTSHTVSQLKSLLFPESPTKPAQTLGGVTTKPKSGIVRPTRDGRIKGKKQPNSTLRGPPGDVKTLLDKHDREILATEIFNFSLKALSEVVKVQSLEKIQCIGNTQRHKTSPHSPERSPRDPQSPLQPVCGNIVRLKKEQSKSPRKTGFVYGTEVASGLLAQAECAGLALSALRMYRARKDSNEEPPSLQIENALSTLISKFIALGLLELAVKELYTLKILLLAAIGVTNKAESIPSEHADRKSKTAGLLVFPRTDIKGSLLVMVVTFQLQVTRLIAASRDTSLSKAAIEHFQIKMPYSPANLIQAQAVPHDPSAPIKIATQLETFSRMIASMCPSTSKTEDPCDRLKSMDPLTALRLQLLSLELRSLWWRVAGHKGDYVKDLIDPFSRFLGTFRRQGITSLKTGYIIAKDTIARLTSSSQTTEFRSSAAPAQCEAWRSIYFELFEISRSSCSNEDAIKWLEEYMKLPVDRGMSPCRRCIEVCKMATMGAHVIQNSPSEKDTVMAFQNAEKHIKGDLKGSSEELDSLLLVITRLRKVAGIIINNFAASRKNHLGPPPTDLVRQCYSMCSTAVIFLNKYIGSRPTQSAEHPAVRRYQQRLQQASAVTRAFVDSVLIVARLSKEDNSNQWTLIDEGIQVCLALAATIPNSNQHPVANLADNSASSSTHVSVANVYWLRYIHLKQNNEETEARKALRASIDAVEQRSLSDKSAAQLQVRLEHYAGAMEIARDYQKSAESYLKAIRMHVEMQNLQRAAAAATQQALTTIFARQSEFAALGRVLGAFPRVATKIQSDTELGRTFFDDEQLDISTRGTALEQQLDSLISRIGTGSLKAKVSSTIQDIAKILLNVYSGQCFSIRRLRVVETLMWLHSNRPEVLSSGLLQQLAEDQNDTTPNELQSSDFGLQFLAPHLLASKDAALAIIDSCPKVKRQKLESALATWHKLVKQWPDLKALEQAAGDISVWLLHLESLAQYLDAYGFSWLRLSTLELLISLRERTSPLGIVALVSSLTQYGLQYVRLSLISEAGAIFHKAYQYVKESNLTKEAGVLFYTGYAEYFLATGNISKCEENLALAREVFEKGEGENHGESVSTDHRNKKLQLVASIASVCSELAARQGHQSEALLLARQSLRHAHQVWTSTAKSQKRSRIEASEKESKDEIDGMIDSIATTTISDNSQGLKGSATHSKAPVFWNLIPQLHRAFLQISHHYVNEGMLNEAKYHLERSRQFAQEASASGLLGESLVHLANIMTRSEDHAGANSNFELAAKLYSSLEKDQHNIRFHVSLSAYHLAKGEISDAEGTCGTALSMLQRLLTMGHTQNARGGSSMDLLEEQLSNFTIGEDIQCLPASEKRVLVKKPGGKASKSSSVRKVNNLDSYGVRASSLAFSNSKSNVLHQQIRLALHQGRLEQVSDLLAEAANRYHTSQEIILHAMFAAEASVKRGLDAIIGDPVFCVLTESTISIPSILQVRSLGLSNSPKPKGMKVGRGPRKGGPVPVRGTKMRAPPQSNSVGHCQEFREAEIGTSKVFELAQSICSTASLHDLSKLMAKNLMMLSALDLSSTAESCRPCPNRLLRITDAARSTAMMRSLRAIRVEKTTPVEDTDLRWPVANASTTKERPALALTPDAASFQEQYLDIIPNPWQVLSISLSRSRGEIIVSRLRSGQSPFVLSMPLDRHSSRDPDEESFGYLQAKTELEEIITLADQTTHNTQDPARKNARSAWWEGRAALDARLRDLLANIEHMWLGGFHGVLSSRLPHRDLLARFQVSLNAILDNHLPSRRGQGKKQQPKPTNFDPRVVELFVALGDPVDLAEMEEPLMDLLYFIIDILQFQGERNAYDEVDFDSMTIATLDALRQYHEAAKKIDEPLATQHTILILDKELHCFPWESLPCLAGQAVTRLPSLNCLRDRILLQRQQAFTMDGVVQQEGKFCVDRRNGAYVLNPAGDLKATQDHFEQPLSDLSGWEALTGCEPSEEQMKDYLQQKDIFLYFGHGSGNQYIRTRTIQRLDKCAVALLMGCSSGKVTEAGEFEPYGTPMSYMQAGCPTMLATLWDVTDKDIDRFSETVLHKWGLFQSKAPPENSPIKKTARSRGKSKARQEPRPTTDVGNVSLDQAVAQGRGSCIFRYLNGAAPVVYGIPVFLG
ncbi:MAG: hypothetical protein Q9223_003709 [Gallowayella weberi]